MNKITTILRQFYTTYLREMKIVLHDQGMLLFLLFLPVAYPIIYSLIYNPEVVRDVKMVIVDEDRTQQSRELVRNLDATQWVHVTGYAADMQEARKAVNSHEAYGILQIPAGYSKGVVAGSGGQAVLYAEMSLLLRYKAMLLACTDLMTEYGAELRTQNLNTSDIAGVGSAMQQYGDLMPIEAVSLGNIANGFDSFIMPGVLVLILHQCIVLSIGMMGGNINERKRLMPSVKAAKMPGANHILTVMTARSLVYITILLLPIIFLLHYVPLIFKFPMAGDPLQIFVFIVPMIFAATAVGFIMQAVVKERESVFLIWVVTSMLLIFLSGLTWPRTAMSPFWHFVSNLCPSTWGVEGFIRMNSNGASLSQVSTDYYALWILALGYTAIAYIVQRRIVKPLNI